MSLSNKIEHVSIFVLYNKRYWISINTDPCYYYWYKYQQGKNDHVCKSEIKIMFHLNVLMNNLKLKIIQDVSSRTWQVYINRKTSKRPCMHKNVQQKKKINWKSFLWWRWRWWGWFSNWCFKHFIGSLKAIVLALDWKPFTDYNYRTNLCQ